MATAINSPQFQDYTLKRLLPTLSPRVVSKLQELKENEVTKVWSQKRFALAKLFADVGWGEASSFRFGEQEHDLVNHFLSHTFYPIHLKQVMLIKSIKCAGWVRGYSPLTEYGARRPRSSGRCIQSTEGEVDPNLGPYQAIWRP